MSNPNALKLPRLKASRWDGWDSTTGSTTSPFMQATFGGYSWKDRPIISSDPSKIPLFWNPAQAARSLGLSLSDYYAQGLCAVPPGSPRALRRPRAVLYSVVQITTNPDDGWDDPVGEALAPLASLLLEKGVWAGTAYWTGGNVVSDGAGAPLLQIEGEVGPLRMVGGGLPPAAHEELVYGTSGLGDLTITYPEFDDAPVQAGEILYVMLDQFVNSVPFSAYNGVGYDYYSILHDAAVAEMLAQGDAHDRCCFYGGYSGESAGTEWADAQAKFADLKAAADPYFDYSASGGQIRLDGGGTARAAVQAAVVAKVTEFFNLGG